MWSRNLLPSVQHKGSLPYSYKPATAPSPKPVEFRSHPLPVRSILILFHCQEYLNINEWILQETAGNVLGIINYFIILTHSLTSIYIANTTFYFKMLFTIILQVHKDVIKITFSIYLLQHVLASQGHHQATIN
jgi:hypothetical protein